MHLKGGKSPAISNSTSNPKISRILYPTEFKPNSYIKTNVQRLSKQSGRIRINIKKNAKRHEKGLQLFRRCGRS